jgi:hypothetical protein
VGGNIRTGLTFGRGCEIKYTTDTFYVDNAKGRAKEGTSTRKAADAETSWSPANMPSVPIRRKVSFQPIKPYAFTKVLGR